MQITGGMFKTDLPLILFQYSNNHPRMGGGVKRVEKKRKKRETPKSGTRQRRPK